MITYPYDYLSYDLINTSEAAFMNNRNATHDPQKLIISHNKTKYN